MAAPKSAKKVQRYSDEFKLKAVAMANMEGVKTQDVAEELAIHPFMLSRWKKEVREGKLVGKQGVQLNIEGKMVAELRELNELRRKYRMLKEEHELLKKAIRFSSEKRKRSSSTSKGTRVSTRSR